MLPQNMRTRMGIRLGPDPTRRLLPTALPNISAWPCSKRCRQEFSDLRQHQELSSQLYSNFALRSAIACPCFRWFSRLINCGSTTAVFRSAVGR
jgi:hypothetical protein